MPKVTTSSGVHDVQDLEISAEVAALKSGLGPFYGRLLAALERIADALEAKNA